MAAIHYPQRHHRDRPGPRGRSVPPCPTAPVATGGSIGFDSFTYVLTQTAALQWLGNSLWVTLVTVIAAVVVAAPAGYVVSRGRNRLVAGYSMLMFVIQSLPIVVFVIPLFIMFAGLGLATP
jgi:multiple sugar transport system permease protein